MGHLPGHTIKGAALFHWSWEAYPLTQFLWILHPAVASRHTASCSTNRAARQNHSRNLCTMNYSPSGGGLETRVPCEVLALEHDIKQDWHGYRARAFNALHPTCLRHTHASVVSQLNNLAGAGRNSPGALWCPSSPSSPETVKSSQRNTDFVPWPGTGVSIWSWVGSAIVQGAMDSRLSHVTAAYLRAPAHLFQYRSYPYFTFCPKTCLD